MKTTKLFLIFGLLAIFSYNKLSAQSAIPVLLGLGACVSNGTATGNTGLGFNALNLNNTIENTAVGSEALANTAIYPAEQGAYNTAVGARSLKSNTSGRYNCAFGQQAMLYNTAGSWNTSVGRRSLEANTTGIQNTVLGYASNYICNGNGNIGLGYWTGGDYFTSGNGNIFLGNRCADGLQSGNENTFIGQVYLPLNSNISNTIILADGKGYRGRQNQRLYFHSNGFGGVGLGNNVIPLNTFEIKALAGSPTESGFTASGLRLTSLPNTNFNQTQTANANKVLSVNGSGDVILVDDATGGGGTSNLQNECHEVNFLPKVVDAEGNFTCSQIYDNWNGNTRPAVLNSSGVSIGYYPTPPNNIFIPSGTLTGPFGQTPTKLKLRVNGASQANFTLITSDQNYKKNIHPLDRREALERVLQIKGFSYNWDKDNNPAINFDDNDHTGFIAQQLDSILPHLVYNTEDIIEVRDREVRYDRRKSVNYIELIPYLVESIKTLNEKITDLESQIVCLNEKTGCNQIAYKASATQVFENTKIVMVSPNPSKDIISVSVNIEKEVENATLQIFDVNGKQLQTINIRERGNEINKTLLKDNYGSGIYFVSLFANGKSVDTKKIVFE